MENKSNAMLIAYHNRKARKTRNIFVYANDGKVHIIMQFFYTELESCQPKNLQHAQYNNNVLTYSTGSIDLLEISTIVMPPDLCTLALLTNTLNGLQFYRK